MRIQKYCVVQLYDSRGPADKKKQNPDLGSCYSVIFLQLDLTLMGICLEKAAYQLTADLCWKVCIAK